MKKKRCPRCRNNINRMESVLRFPLEGSATKMLWASVNRGRQSLFFIFLFPHFHALFVSRTCARHLPAPMFVKTRFSERRSVYADLLHQQKRNLHDSSQTNSGAPSFPGAPYGEGAVCRYPLFTCGAESYVCYIMVMTKAEKPYLR